MFPWQLDELQSRLTKKSGLAKSGLARWIELDWARATDRVATDRVAAEAKIRLRITRVQIWLMGKRSLWIPELRFVLIRFVLIRLPFLAVRDRGIGGNRCNRPER